MKEKECSRGINQHIMIKRNIKHLIMGMVVGLIICLFIPENTPDIVSVPKPTYTDVIQVTNFGTNKVPSTNIVWNSGYFRVQTLRLETSGTNRVVNYAYAFSNAPKSFISIQQDIGMNAGVFIVTNTTTQTVFRIRNSDGYYTNSCITTVIATD